MTPKHSRINDIRKMLAAGVSRRVIAEVAGEPVRAVNAYAVSADYAAWVRDSLIEEVVLALPLDESVAEVLASVAPEKVERGYDPKTAREICTLLAQGKTLRSICAGEHGDTFPGYRATYDWTQRQTAFGVMIEKARCFATHLLVDELEEIVRESAAEQRPRLSPRMLREHTETLIEQLGEDHAIDHETARAALLAAVEITRRKIDPKAVANFIKFATWAAEKRIAAYSKTHVGEDVEKLLASVFGVDRDAARDLVDHALVEISSEAFGEPN